MFVCRFYPAVKVWAVHELKVVEGLQRLLEERQLLRVQLRQVDTTLGTTTIGVCSAGCVASH